MWMAVENLLDFYGIIRPIDVDIPIQLSYCNLADDIHVLIQGL
jgi:hypothetical protein